MHRTPAKSVNEVESLISLSPTEQQDRPSLLNTTKTLSVRRSVGEWESANAESSQKLEKTQSPACRATTEATKTPPKKAVCKSRYDEARMCLSKAKMCLSSSRNLKSDLKHDIAAAVERLFQLVKEAEAELTKAKGSGTGKAPPPQRNVQSSTALDEEETLKKRLEENSKLLRENMDKMEELKSHIELQRASSYANAVVSGRKSAPTNGALHSVVITSKDEMETGEEVLGKVRRALDAKEGWIKVERVRKARDRKVIMGFDTKEERDKAKKRIEQDSAHLSVEEVKNKDPLLILRDVLRINSDEDVMRALRSQNRSVFDGLATGEDRIGIKYKRNTRNPLTCHLILSVAPKIWSRATEKGRLRIDLQQVRVEDQSPLVQCTRCLGYGHGRRFCKEPADLCSHCGGPHLRAECPDRLVGENPACRNCVGAKLRKTDHNAFSQDCPVRRKWDQMARSTVAYC